MSNRANAGWEQKSSLVKGVDHFVSIIGNGTGQPTKREGQTVTLNRTGVGIIEVIWPDNPGVYCGVKGRCFEATTASQVKGFTVVPGDYDTTNLKITLNITNAAETLTDLSSTQRLSITFAFKQSPAVT